MQATEFDIKNAYLHHRLRVRCAKAIIDHHPPLLHAGNFSRFSKMKEDVQTLMARNKQNTQLLIALNRVVRTKGEIDTFRTADNSFAPNYCKLPQKYRLLQQLDFENVRIGKKIMCAKPELDTWLSEKFKRKVIQQKPTPFKYPALVMSKYSNIEIPENPLQLEKFLRPKIWFNLEVKDVRPLGRIIMELYTEAAPQVVMEFVRLCFAKQKERINFIRLFPRLWLEGEISLDESTLIKKNIEYDKRSLDHGQFVGVLSFNVRNVKCSQKAMLNFTLSFKPLRVCNGRRVGFGHVCRGFKVLSCIEDFGTKNGKPSKEIVVSNCGIFV
ncbi:peptidyl-prolyl cis-trans isomerase E-like [Calliphora vicina]|uniref:peptidyl-prolyl cis-trans isomerase E-like n=1 Tax=Calliphora vicina TaxID=7373 RepID=UPI00325A7058